MRLSRFFIFLLSVAFLVAPLGCAAKPGAKYVGTYCDECYQPIRQLYEDQSSKGSVLGAVVGGTIGAVAGAIIGAQANGGEGAIIGAVAGGATGAVVGFSISKYRSIQSQNQRLTQYRQDLDNADRELDLTRAAVATSLNCYKNELKKIRIARRRGKMSNEEATARIEEIKQGIQFAKEFWDERVQQMDRYLTDATKDENLREIVSNEKSSYTNTKTGRTADRSRIRQRLTRNEEMQYLATKKYAESKQRRLAAEDSSISASCDEILADMNAVNS